MKQRTMTISAPRTAAVEVVSPFSNLGNVVEQASAALRLAGCSVGVRESFRSYLDAPEASVLLDFQDPERWAHGAFGFLTHPVSIAPDAWATGMRLARGVFAPSEWMCDAARGQTQNVTLLRFGVDEAFSFAPKTRGDKLRVLFCIPNDLEYHRKGMDIAVNAFLAAFPGRDNVELVIRSPRPLSWEKPEDARIRFAVGRLTFDEMALLYRSSDVLLYPSRAEAFGHVALEAMACGTPVIHTGATGMGAFTDLGLTVPYRETHVAILGPNPNSGWMDANQDACSGWLCEVDKNWRVIMARAEKDAHQVRRRFSWSIFAEKLLKKL